MTSPSFTVNQSTLAEILEVSAKTVQQWDRDGLREAARLKAGGRSAKYDLVAALKWHHARECDELRAQIRDVASEMDTAKLRKLEAEAEMKELEVAVRRGELVPFDEVDEVVGACNEAVDSVLRQTPARFAPVLAKEAGLALKAARAILKDVIEIVRGAIREEAADHLPPTGTE